jgi:voltage-gated potassium channel
VEHEEARFRHPVFGRLRYVFSLIALVDLLAVLPYYLAAIVPIDLRFLRVLRILRILKLSHYFAALDVLLEVARKERNAFGAAFFLLALGTLFASSGIYLCEHEIQPVAFGSIPAAMWWAVATLTTVGYGDVTPVTVAGKVFGASITVMGIGMVALPTGILASGFSEELRRRQQRYGAEMRSALADGVLDGFEREHLERLRRELGLSEEEVAGLGEERRDFSSQPPRKCPHCGEAVE